MADFIEIISAESLARVEKLVDLLHDVVASSNAIQAAKGGTPSGVDQIVKNALDKLKEQEAVIKRLTAEVDKLTTAYQKLKLSSPQGTTAKGLSKMTQDELNALDLRNQKEQALHDKKMKRLQRQKDMITAMENDGLLLAEHNASASEKTLNRASALRKAAKDKEKALTNEQIALDRKKEDLAIEGIRRIAAENLKAKKEFMATPEGKLQKAKEATALGKSDIGTDIMLEKMKLAEHNKEMRLAIMASGKLGDAYQALKAQRQQAAITLQHLIASETASTREIRNAKRAFEELDAKVRRADQAVGRFTQTGRSVMGFARNVGAMITGFLGAFGIRGGVLLIADLVKNFYETTKAIQSMDLALKMVSGTAENFKANQAFLNELTEKWGVEIKSATKNFTDFYASAKGLLSDQQIKEVFEGISKAASIMGRSVEQQEQTFLALEQMMSKGTIQAEELKRQLGNALPGAMRAAAMAYMEVHPEVTKLQIAERELLKDMKKGLIDSATYVPLIVKQFQKLYGIEQVEQVNTLAAAQNRLSNSWVNLVRSMNENEDGGLTRFFSTLLDLLQRAIDKLARFNTSWKTLFEMASGKGFREGEVKFTSQVGTRMEDLRKLGLKRLEEKGAGDDPKARAKFNEAFKKIEKDETGRLANAAIKASTEELKTLNEAKENLLKSIEKAQAAVDADTFNKVKIVSQLRKDLKALNLELEKVEKNIGTEEGIIFAAENMRDFVATSIPPEEKEGKGKKTPGERDLKFLNLESAAIRKNYDAEIAKLEDLRQEFRNVMDDEAAAYDDRLAAQDEYSKLSYDILREKEAKEKDLALQAQKDKMAQEMETYKDNIEKNKANIANGYANESEKIEASHARNVILINQNLGLDLQRIGDQFSRERKKQLAADAAFETMIETKKNQHLINMAESYHQIVMRRLRKAFDNPNATLREKNDAFMEMRMMELESLRRQEERALEATPLNDEEKRKEIIAHFANLRDEVLSVISPLEEARRATDEWMNSLTGDFFNNAGFTTLFRILNEELTGFGENWAATFEMIAEVGQETMNFLAQSIQDNTDAQIKELDKEKETAMAFAADTEDAKSEIERIYQQRRAEIERQNFEKKKKLAIANIMIDGAQAIIGAWVKPGWPMAFGITALIAALMAAQIGVVSSQQVEGFWKGTDNAPEGLARTDEQGAELHTDKHGNIKDFGSDKGPRLKYLSKGDKIFTAAKTKDILERAMFNKQLNSILANSEINPILVSGGSWDSKDFNSGIDKLAHTISSKQSFSMHIDRQGERIYREEQGRRTELVNNRLNIRTFNV